MKTFSWISFLQFSIKINSMNKSGLIWFQLFITGHTYRTVHCYKISMQIFLNTFQLSVQSIRQTHQSILYVIDKLIILFYLTTLEGL